MTTEQELQLVKQAQANIAAFAQLYDHYFPKIFSYCQRRLPDTDSAKDVTSEVFMAAVEHIQKFDHRKGVKFGSWLYRIAHNKIVDTYRRRGRELLDITNIPVASEHQTETAADQEYRELQIKSVLRKIKPRYQLALTLRYFQELDNPEIAEIMELNSKQVAVVLHRALKTFRRIYTKKYPTSEIFSLDERNK